MSAGTTGFVWKGEAAQLARRVLDFMDRSIAGQAAQATFDEIALSLHTWQWNNDQALRKLLAQPAHTINDIPYLPVELFKLLSIGTLSASEPSRTFLSSGTTGQVRSQHRLRSTHIYDHGALAWAQHCVPNAPSDIVALLESPTSAPDSSLSHMAQLFGDCSWHITDGQLDVASLQQRTREASKPLYVISTAFSLASWLTTQQAMPLPQGSVLMVTGGMKGRKTTLDDTELYGQAQAQLQPQRLVTEYGMTELCSQCWGTPSGPFKPAPWLRVHAIDPQNGKRLAPGQEGQLRFLDLANLDSTLGIETEDRGVIDKDGNVHLLGRVAGSELRGCSLRFRGTTS